MNPLRTTLATTMKPFHSALLLASLTSASCSSLSTNFDYDTSHDFSGLRTYAWTEKQDDSIDLKRVHAAVDATLAQRGFTLSSSNPDFQVAAHISRKDKLRVTDWGYTAGPRSYWYGGHDVDVTQYEEGTLILDVIDSDKKQLIWRGTASRPVDQSWSAEDRDEIAREAVQALLDEFPPKR